MADADVLIKVAADIASATDGIQQLVQQMQVLVDATVETSNAAEESEPKVKSFWDAWGQGAEGGTASAVAFGNIASDTFQKFGAAIGDGLKALPGMITGVADAGDAALTMSNRLGISVESIARLQYISGQTGAPVEGMARAIQGLGTSLENASSKSAKGIESIGLDINKLKAAKPEEAFTTIIKQIKETVPASEQSAKAMEIFGNRFRGSTMLLREDVDGISKKFDELGGGMTENLARMGDDFNDAIGDIHLKQQQFHDDVASIFLPAINSILKAMPQLGGAVLTIGEGMIDFGKSMLPVMGNLAMMAGPQGIMGVIPMIEGMAGAIWKQLVPAFAALEAATAEITIPIGLLIVGVAALLAILYELMGGWDGVKSAVMGAIQFFKDLWTIVWRLNQIIVEGLVEAAKGLVKWFTGAKESGGLLGTAIKVLVAYFETLWKMAQQAYEAVAWFFKKTGEITHTFAEQIRKEDADAEAEAERKKKAAGAAADAAAGATVKEYTALELLEHKAWMVNTALGKLTEEQKKRIAVDLAAGITAKELGDVYHNDLGVSAETATLAIDKLKKGLDDAKKAADSSAFGKLTKEATDLGKALSDAHAAHQSEVSILETMGKKAAELVAHARLIPDAFAKLKPEIVALGASWDSAQLAEKMKPVTAEATKLADTFGAKTTAAAHEAQQAVTSMTASMAANLMSAHEKALFLIEEDRRKSLDAIEQKKIAEQQALDADITAIKQNFDKQRQLAKEFSPTGEATQEQLAAIRIKEEAAIAAARSQTAAVITGLNAEVVATQAASDQKTAIENKHTGNVQVDAKLMGLKTKEMYEQEVRDQQQAYDEMLQNEDAFVQADIEAKRKQLQAARDMLDEYGRMAKAAGITTQADRQKEYDDALNKLTLMKDAKSGASASEIDAQQRVVNASKRALNQQERDAAAHSIKTKAVLDDEAAAADAHLKDLQDNRDKYTAKEIYAAAQAARAAHEAADQSGTAWKNSMSQVSSAMTAVFKLAGPGWAGVAEGIAQAAAAGSGLKTSLGGMKDAFKAGDWGSMASNGVAAFGQIKDAAMGVWKAAGAGGAKGIAGGAMAGMQAGAAFGPYGAAVGAAAGAIVGVVKTFKNTTKTAREDFAKSLGKDNLDALYTDLKQLGTKGEELAHLGASVIGKKDQKANEKWMEDVKKFYADVQTQLEGMATTTGLWSDEQDKLAKSSAETGENLDKVNAARQQQIVMAGQGISKALTISDTALKSYDQLNAKQMELTKQMSEESDPAALKSLQTELDATMKDLNVAGQIWTATQLHSENAAKAVSGSLLGVVMAQVKAGESFVDAIREAGPSINDLRDQFVATGFAGGQAFDLLKSASDIVNDDIAGPALQAVEGYTQGMVGLANAGLLNQESFSGFTEQIGGTEAALEAEGQSHGAVMVAMQTDLQKVWEMQQKYGYSVDDATQKLIDEGVQSGLIGEQGKTDNEKILDVLTAIATALGATIPESLKSFAKAGKSAADTVTDATKKAADAAAGVQKNLDKTDWSGWSKAAVDASKTAEGAVNAVSFGHSPGGIKEIPIQLDEAMKSFKQFGAVGTKATEAVYKQMEAMQDLGPDDPTRNVEAQKSMEAMAAAANMATYQAEKMSAKDAGIVISEGAIAIDRPILKDRESTQELAVEVAKQLKRAVGSFGAWRK